MRKLKKLPEILSRGRWVRSALVACAALLCLCTTSHAWSNVPTDGLSDEQRALVDAMPAPSKPVTYLEITGTRSSDFFLKNAKADATYVRQMLKKDSFDVDTELSRLTGSGPLTGEDLERAQFLRELTMVKTGYVSADEDISINDVYFSGKLPGMSYKQLLEAKSSHAWQERYSHSTASKESQYKVWASMIDAWVAYRALGAPEELGTDGWSEAARTLYEAVPAFYRPLTYCALTGMSAQEYFKRTSGFGNSYLDEIWNRLSTGNGWSVVNEYRYGQTADVTLMVTQMFFAKEQIYSSMLENNRSCRRAWYSEMLQRKSADELKALLLSAEKMIALSENHSERMTALQNWKPIVQAWYNYCTYAYTQVPLEKLTAEQRELVEALPEEFRLKAYVYFTGEDAAAVQKEYNRFVKADASRAGLPDTFAAASLSDLRTAYRGYASGADAARPLGENEALAQLTREIINCKQGYYCVHTVSANGELTDADAMKLEEMNLGQIIDVRNRLAASQSSAAAQAQQSMLNAWIRFRLRSSDLTERIKLPLDDRPAAEQALLNALPEEYRLAVFMKLKYGDSDVDYQKVVRGLPNLAFRDGTTLLSYASADAEELQNEYVACGKALQTAEGDEKAALLQKQTTIGSLMVASSGKGVIPFYELATGSDGQAKLYSLGSAELLGGDYRTQEALQSLRSQYGSNQTAAQVIDAFIAYRNAIAPGVAIFDLPMKDTVREVTANGVETVRVKGSGSYVFTVYQALELGAAEKTLLSALTAENRTPALSRLITGKTSGGYKHTSSQGNYTKTLDAMSYRELADYRGELESAYNDLGGDAARRQELDQWLSQVSAWIAYRRPAGGAEPTSRRELPTDSGQSGGGAPGAYGTYLLEVSTGVNPGDLVEYFKIIYRSANGTEYEQFIFPGQGALYESYSMAKEAGMPRGEALSWVRDNLGYETADPLEAKALQSYHTDQFLFRPEGQLSSVTELQVFMRADRTGKYKNAWTCQDMRIYRVSALGGLVRYGRVSSDAYVDFEGTLVAEATFSTESRRNMSWTNSKLFRFGGEKAENGYGVRMASGNEKARQLYQRDNVIFRLDFADTAAAGLDYMSTTVDGNKTLLGGNAAEVLALTVRYLDNCGDVRETTLPVVSNAAEWFCNDQGHSGTRDFAGLAQQGEKLAFPGVLPCFDPETGSILGMTVTLGAKTVANLAGMKAVGGNLTQAAQNSRSRQIDASEPRTAPGSTGAAREIEGTRDDAAFSFAAVYAGAEGLSAEYVDNFIRYTFMDTPKWYHTASDASGELVRAAGSGTVVLDNSTRRAESEGRYLITIRTDAPESSGTRQDLTLRLKYVTMEGAARETEPYSVRAYVNDFYGQWPNSGGSADFAYYYGASPNGELKMLVTIRDVRNFTGASLTMAAGSTDDYQFSDLRIQRADDVSVRSMSWTSVRLTPSAGSELTSDRVYDRTVTGEQLFDLASSAPGGTHILLQNGETKEIAAETKEVARREDVDWQKLRYNMTFVEAMQNLDFTRARKNYNVTVQVATDERSTYVDDDSGSRNKFYFQLVFSGGQSGYVLANQQLSSDGFRSGTAETFTVTTSQDYGVLSAVKIIPDDMSGTSDIYDKLKINSIRVVQQDNSGVSPTWEIGNVGWIGIDYRDEGRATSVSGQPGRSIDELARTYKVTNSSYTLNFLVSITTAPYGTTEAKDENGKTVVTQDPQFEGDVSAEIRYIDSNGNERDPVVISDVVRLMYNYNNRAPVYDSFNRGGVTSVNGRASSDPRYMFRAGKTDRFIIQLSSPEQILSMSLNVRSKVKTNWNVSDVTISQIKSDGSLIVNSSDEYEIIYPSGSEPAYVTSGSAPSYKAQVSAAGNDQESGIQTMNIVFKKNEIASPEQAMERTSTVTNLPESTNDTLDIVVYGSGVNTNVPRDGFDLKTSVAYSTELYSSVQAPSDVMSKQVMRDGTTVYYATGLSASGLKGVKSLTASVVSSGTSTTVGIRRAVVRHMRGDVVVATYEFGGATVMRRGAALPATGREASKQTLTLQFGASTPTMSLLAGKNDLAVSIWYKDRGPVGQGAGAREYNSPNVFLTEQGVTEIGPGRIVELRFEESEFSEITGVSITPTGTVSAEVSAAILSDLADDGGGAVERGRYSFANGVTAAGAVPRRMNPTASTDAADTGVVEPLTLTFRTGAATENSGGGIDVPVRLRIGYISYRTQLTGAPVSAVREYADIRDFIDGDVRAFRSGETATVRLLASDMKQIRWIELMPVPEIGADTVGQAWNLQSVTLERSGANRVERGFSDPLLVGENYHVNLANIVLSGMAYAVSPNTAGGAVVIDNTKADAANKAMAVSGGKLDILLDSGQSLYVSSALTGSELGVNASLSSYDPGSQATGVASLGDTRGYTVESIARSAAETADPGEAALWRALRPETGVWNADASFAVRTIDNVVVTDADGKETAQKQETTEALRGVLLTPPRNYSGNTLYYRIVLSSVEAPDVQMAVVVGVRPEKDPFQEKLEQYRSSPKQTTTASVPTPTPAAVPTPTEAPAGGENAG